MCVCHHVCVSGACDYKGKGARAHRCEEQEVDGHRHPQAATDGANARAQYIHEVHGRLRRAATLCCNTRRARSHCHDITIIIPSSSCSSSSSHSAVLALAEPVLFCATQPGSSQTHHSPTATPVAASEHTQHSRLSPLQSHRQAAHYFGLLLRQRGWLTRHGRGRQGA